MPIAINLALGYSKYMKTQTITEGTKVFMKNQLSKREAVVDGLADNGNLLLVRFESGATKVVTKNSVAIVKNG